MTATISGILEDIGARAKGAAAALACVTAEKKIHALQTAARLIRENATQVLAANAQDVAAAKQKGLAAPMIDRLALDEKRVAAIADGLDAIAALPDPVGAVISEWTRPNGLLIKRVRAPIGVVGIIYESRPNVTADAAGLCIKSGNAAILRGGSESFHSSGALAALIRQALKECQLPTDAVQMIPTTDRDAVGLMLTLNRHIDVIVPRGGKTLTQRVISESRVPVFAHLDGVCHVYIEKTADLKKAVEITLNAKMRRVSICGAAETLLIDRAIAQTHLPPVLKALKDAGCAIRGDQNVCKIDPEATLATHEDWGREYLDAIIAVRIVENLDEAIAHINAYGSHHTDSIISEDPQAVARFMQRVDSGIVLHNASTQFADGGEFGFGAEIGIATGKLHARGPVGAEQLTTYKYCVYGKGQTRP